MPGKRRKDAPWPAPEYGCPAVADSDKVGCGRGPLSVMTGQDPERTEGAPLSLNPAGDYDKVAVCGYKTCWPLAP